MYIPELIGDRRASQIRLSVVVSEMLLVVPEPQVPEYYGCQFDTDSPIVGLVTSGGEVWCYATGNNGLERFLDLVHELCPDRECASVMSSHYSYKEVLDTRDRLIAALTEREDRCRT